MATSFATASTVVGLGSSLSKRACLSSDFVKPVMVRSPLRQAQASKGRFTCMSFQSDWLRRDLNVIGFGLIGWLVPSSVPAIDGKSLTGLFFDSIGTELAHFPTPPALTSQFWWWLICWHLGLFITLIFGQIGFKGSSSNISTSVVTTKIIHVLPRFPSIQNTRKRVSVVGCLSKKKDHDALEHPLQTTRRLALGLASIALVENASSGAALAEDNNGFWLDGPLPVPSAENKIANEETGTRSFLKNHLYMADIGTNGRKYRLKKYAFDLMAMVDLIAQDKLNYVQKYLRLKSTFMYFDFDKVITAAPVTEKQPLTDLANKLFNTVEKLDDVVRQRNLPETETYYQDTTVILQEVMDRMT